MNSQSHISSSVDDCLIISLPTVQSDCGTLTSYKNGGNLPFDVRRIYFTYDIPAGSERGGHSHHDTLELVIPLVGAFDIVIEDGVNTRRITLNRPDRGLLLTRGIWRTLDNFSAGAICLVLASEPFDEADYVRDYDQFLKLTQSKRK